MREGGISHKYILQSVNKWSHVSCRTIHSDTQSQIRCNVYVTAVTDVLTPPRIGVNTGVSTPAERGVNTFQHLQKLVLTHPVSTVCQR